MTMSSILVYTTCTIQDAEEVYTYDQDHDEESWDEEKVRERDARLALRHIQNHIGDECFTRLFKT
jgi:hypothetical protein